MAAEVALADVVEADETYDELTEEIVMAIPVPSKGAAARRAGSARFDREWPMVLTRAAARFQALFIVCLRRKCL